MQSLLARYLEVIQKDLKAQVCVLTEVVVCLSSHAYCSLWGDRHGPTCSGADMMTMASANPTSRIRIPLPRLGYGGCIGITERKWKLLYYNRVIIGGYIKVIQGYNSREHLQAVSLRLSSAQAELNKLNSISLMGSCQN